MHDNVRYFGLKPLVLTYSRDGVTLSSGPIILSSAAKALGVNL